MEELKTQVITFKSDDDIVNPNALKPLKTGPLDSQALSTCKTQIQSSPKIEIQEESAPQAAIKLDTKPIAKLNVHYESIPKFYKKELKRYFLIVIMWVVLTLACLGFEGWGLYAILTDSNLSNFIALTLIPGLVLCIAFLINYANKFINFRSEAKTVDFSKDKTVTINVMRLYKRLKTAYININWMCGLAYAAAGITILILYITSWAMTISSPSGPQWGDLSATGMPIFNILFWVCISVLFIAFFLHVYLLFNNSIRAAKIDNFYNVQIVSDEELSLIKKRKNKRDLIIFFVVIMIFVLFGILIYKIVMRRKTTNNVVINN